MADAPEVASRIGWANIGVVEEVLSLPFAPRTDGQPTIRFFYDEDPRAQLLADQPDILPVEQMGFREFAYNTVLMLLAEQRTKEQKSMQPADMPTWKKAWTPSEASGKDLMTTHGDILQTLGRQLVTLNNLERARGRYEGRERLREKQRGLIGDVLARLSSRPLDRRQPGAWPDKPIPRTILVKAPTGSGKTAVLGWILQAADVDRASVVVPSKELTEQMLGRVGNDTLRRFAPDKLPDADYEDRKVAQHGWPDGVNVLVTPIPSYKRLVASKVVIPQHLDMQVFDEGHHGKQPQLLAQLKQGDIAPVALYFTATPKGLTLYVDEYVDAGSVREFVDAGLLNGVQLFSFKLDIADTNAAEGLATAEIKKAMQKAAEDRVVKLALRDVGEGRKVTIFCQEGGRSAQAKRISKALTELGVRAEALSFADTIGRTREKRLAFDGDSKKREELDVLCTVGIGREAWDPKRNDSVIIIGNHGPETLEQMAGRGLRRDATFPVTKIYEIWWEGGQTRASIYDVFECSYITQGLVLGSLDNEQYVPPDVRGNGTSVRRSTEDQKSVGALEDELPPELLALAERVEGVLVRRVNYGVGVTAENDIPEMCDSVNAYALEANLPLEHVLFHLTKLRRPVYSRFEAMEGGQRIEVFYCRSEDLAFIKDHPLPPPPLATEVSVSIGAQYLGLTGSAFYLFMLAQGSPGVMRMGEGLRRRRYFGRDAVAALELILAAAEWELPGDATLAEFATSMGWKEAYAWRRLCGLRNPPSFAIKRFAMGNGVGYRLCFKDPNDLLRCYGLFPGGLELPQKGEVWLGEIAEAVGRSHQNVLDLLSLDEVGALVTRRVHIIKDDKPGTAVRRFLPEHLATQVRERLGKRAVPPHLVSLDIMVALLDASRRKISGLLNDKESATYALPVEIGVGKWKQVCYPWCVFARLLNETAILWRSKDCGVDFTKVPRDEKDTDPERIAYAQAIHAYFEASLADVPTIRASLREAGEATAGEARQGEVLLRTDGWPVWSDVDAIFVGYQRRSISRRVLSMNGVTLAGRTSASAILQIIDPDSNRLSSCERDDILCGTTVLPSRARVFRKASGQYAYNEEGLVYLLATHSGFTKDDICHIFGVPGVLVDRELGSENLNTSNKYNYDAWRRARHVFRLPAVGQKPLRLMADAIHWSEERARGLVEACGYTVDEYYDASGARYAFVGPAAYTLLHYQTLALPEPPATYRNRLDVAMVANVPVGVFDDWVAAHVRAIRQARWYTSRRVEYAGKRVVLPHYPPEAYSPFLNDIAPPQRKKA